MSCRPQASVACQGYFVKISLQLDVTGTMELSANCQKCHGLYPSIFLKLSRGNRVNSRKSPVDVVGTAGVGAGIGVPVPLPVDGDIS